MIVGAKGGRLQLVLNTVFHLGQPIENIPYTYYKEFTEGRFVPVVDAAIPVCMGHAYEGCPAVATIPEFFEKLSDLDGRPYRFAEGGRNFKSENFFEAVIGSTAAEKTGLKVGDTFHPIATIDEEEPGEDHNGHDAFTVVGILKHTDTPNDLVLFMNMEGFHRCPAHMKAPSFSKRLLGGGAVPQAENMPQAESQGHDHAHHEHEPLSDEQKEVTAILVRTYDPLDPEMRSNVRDMVLELPEVINEEPVAQAVMPAQVISDLFDGIVGNVQLLLLILAVLVVVVAGIGILVSIYNSMNDRRREIAIMRALGAGRLTVMSVILMESILLSLGGGVLGLLLGHGLIGLLAPRIAAQTGVMVGALQFQLVAELMLIPGLIVLATLVGLLPAVAAYRTDVARSLTATA